MTWTASTVAQRAVAGDAPSGQPRSWRSVKRSGAQPGTALGTPRRQSSPSPFPERPPQPAPAARPMTTRGGPQDAGGGGGAPPRPAISLAQGNNSPRAKNGNVLTRPGHTAHSAHRVALHGSTVQGKSHGHKVGTQSSRPSRVHGDAARLPGVGPKNISLLPPPPRCRRVPARLTAVRQGRVIPFIFRVT